MSSGSKRTPNAESAKSEAVRRIVGATNPSRILLFGSSARDSFAQAGDLDLMVIYDGLAADAKRARTRDLYRLLWDLGYPTDIVVASEEDIETKRDVVGYVYSDALREGVTLYERGR